MRNLLFGVLLFLGAAGFASCNNGEDTGGETGGEDTALTVSPSSLTFDAAGSTQSVTITGTGWSATADAEWIEMDDIEGGIDVTVGNSDITRAGAITVSNGTDSKVVTVTQLVDDFITADPRSLSFIAAGESKSVTVSANIDWSATTEDGWITATAVSETELQITVGATVDARIGSVTIVSELDDIVITVNQEEDRYVFTHASGALYQNGAFYGPDKTNSIINFHGFDPSGIWDGWYLTINVISDLADFSKPILDLAPGTYNFTGSGAKFTVDYFYDTRMVLYVEGNPTTVIVKDGAVNFTNTGTMVVEGDHTGYTIKFDLTLSDGTQFRASYNGPLNIDNPNIVSSFGEDQNIGDVPIIDMYYYNNPFPTSPIDMFMIHGYTSGITIENGTYRGNGWAVLAQIHTALDSGIPMTDGTYTIENSLAEGVAFGGTRDYMGQRTGAWVLRLENGIAQDEAPLVSGTVTTTYSGDTYTITVNGVDDAGNNITYTMSGAPAVISQAPAAPAMISGPWQHGNNVVREAVSRIR